MATKSPTSAWTVSDSADLYNLPGWSRGYFLIDGSGHLLVHPGGDGAHDLDLRRFAGGIQREGEQRPSLPAAVEAGQEGVVVQVLQIGAQPRPDHEMESFLLVGDLDLIVEFMGVPAGVALHGQ